jgi:hypothetical protein
VSVTDTILALSNLEERTPTFFVEEALRESGILTIERAKDILSTFGEANRVAPRALKDILINRPTC